MADLGMSFDPAEVPEDERNFEPIPAGDYLCQVVDSDVVATKAGDGSILKLTIEVMDGPYSNRKIFENLNIANPNPQAQQIAQRALADLCLATGVGSIRDSEELHFRPFIARVAIEPDKSGQYAPKNRVRRYKPAQAVPPNGKAAPVQPVQATQAQQPARSAPAAAQQTTGVRPWKRQGAPNAA